MNGNTKAASPARHRSRGLPTDPPNVVDYVKGSSYDHQPAKETASSLALSRPKLFGELMRLQDTVDEPNTAVGDSDKASELACL